MTAYAVFDAWSKEVAGRNVCTARRIDDVSTTNCSTKVAATENLVYVFIVGVGYRFFF